MSQLTVWMLALLAKWRRTYAIERVRFASRARSR